MGWEGEEGVLREGCGRGGEGGIWGGPKESHVCFPMVDSILLEILTYF